MLKSNEMKAFVRGLPNVLGYWASELSVTWRARVSLPAEQQHQQWGWWWLLLLLLLLLFTAYLLGDASRMRRLVFDEGRWRESDNTWNDLIFRLHCWLMRFVIFTTSSSSTGVRDKESITFLNLFLCNYVIQLVVLYQKRSVRMLWW